METIKAAIMSVNKEYNIYWYIKRKNVFIDISNYKMYKIYNIFWYIDILVY